MGSVRYSTLTVEILCQAAGTDELASVRHLQLMVDTTDQPATLIGEELPNLVSLDLSGSVLTSLRDLGTGLSRLEVLTVSHCGLCDLEGLSSFPSLRELYAPNNTVSDLSPLGMASSTTLEVIDLANNDIKDEYALMQLGSCDASLRSLTLEGNPFSTEHLSSPDKEEAYRATVTSYLPGLHRLDGRALPGAPASPSGGGFEANGSSGAAGPVGATSSSSLLGGVPGGGSSFLESTSMVRPSSALGGLGGSDAGNGSGPGAATLAGGLAAASFRRRRLGSTQSTGGVDGGGSLTAARDTLHSAGSLSLGADSFDAVPSPLARGASAGGARPRSSAAFRPGSASAQGSWLGASEGWDDETLGSGATVPVVTTTASSSTAGGNFLSRLAARSGSFGGGSGESGAGGSSGSGSILAVLEAGKAEDARVRRENAATTARMVAETKAAAAAAEAVASAAAAATGGKPPSPLKVSVPPTAPTPAAFPASTPTASPPTAAPVSPVVARGPAAALPDERLVAMLRERPKNVPELHSREAFRRFFSGFPRSRMLALLAEAYGGSYSAEDAAERVSKRLGLVEDLLT